MNALSSVQKTYSVTVFPGKRLLLYEHPHSVRPSIALTEDIYEATLEGNMLSVSGHGYLPFRGGDHSIQRAFEEMIIGLEVRDETGWRELEEWE